MAIYRGADDGPKLSKEGEALGKTKLINKATIDSYGEPFKNELLEVYFEAKDKHDKRKLC